MACFIIKNIDVALRYRKEYGRRQYYRDQRRSGSHRAIEMWWR